MITKRVDVEGNKVGRCLAILWSLYDKHMSLSGVVCAQGEPLELRSGSFANRQQDHRRRRTWKGGFL